MHPSHEICPQQYDIILEFRGYDRRATKETAMHSSLAQRAPHGGVANVRRAMPALEHNQGAMPRWDVEAKLNRSTILYYTILYYTILYYTILYLKGVGGKRCT